MSRIFESMKLLGALAVMGLVVSLGASQSGAEVTAFSPAVYTGRYVCALASDAEAAAGGLVAGDFFTAVVKYNPNGAGGYSAGTLLGALNAFDTDAAGQAGFCQYSLDTTSSFYTVDGHGLGFEKLVWTAAASNDGACPAGGASFTDLTALALRNVTNANGAVIDAEVSDNNLLDITTLENGAGHIGTAGHGYCLK